MTPKIFQDKPDLFKHALSLIVSLIIHAGLLLFLAVHFSSVKVIDFGRKATDVIIAPRSELEIPEVGSLPNLPAVDPDFLEFLPSRAQSPRQSAEVLERIRAGEYTEEPFPDSPVDPKLTSGFGLERPPTEKPDRDSRTELRLSLPERQQGAIGGLTGKVPSAKKIDLLRYLYGNIAGGPAFSGIGVSGRRGRSSLSARTLPSDVRSYDLMPWARNVVEIIQKNWTTPASPSQAGSAVEIAVLISKNGEISMAEVIAPSNDRDFDQAAQLAIELSSPLPRLPDDFPAASVEISFVFSKKQ